MSFKQINTVNLLKPRPPKKPTQKEVLLISYKEFLLLNNKLLHQKTSP